MFKKLKTNKLNVKASELSKTPTEKYNLPILTAGIENQGLNNYGDRNGATILKNVISISANGANTGATFYQNKEFTILQDAYAIDLVSHNCITDNQYLFLAGAIRKSIYGSYAWTDKAGWGKVKNNYIKLPTKNGEIDFEFMEHFIAELEAYLSVTGLKDYDLNDAEKQALEDFENLEWGEFKVTDIFDVYNTKNILAREINPNSGTIPYLCASAYNNSVSTYIDYKEELIDKGNCIFIGGKTFVLSYQEDNFFSNDSHNLSLYLKDSEQANKVNQLYLLTCIRKGLEHKYSWGNSISNNKIKNDSIMINIKNNSIDYHYMQNLISAIQKLVIRDVVDFADRKIAGTRAVVGK